jgi:hypothetical protein
MIVVANFPWHKAYLAAPSETDPAPLSFRISKEIVGFGTTAIESAVEKRGKGGFASSSDSDPAHADTK